MSKTKKAQGQFLLARQIVAHVFEQKLDRGHHLVETALAERFGVSIDQVYQIKHRIRDFSFSRAGTSLTAA